MKVYAFSAIYLVFFASALLRAQSPQTSPQRHATALGPARVVGIDHLEFVGGYGERTSNFRLAAHWDLFSRTRRLYRMDLSLAANYSLFNNPNYQFTPGGQSVDQLRDIGFTPVATFWSRGGKGPLRPFLEMGIGLHYLTEKRVSIKNFSTNFQFGDHIGIGLEFGKKRDYRLAYQFQHLSNGGIESPNPGINFHLLSLGVKVR